MRGNQQAREMDELAGKAPGILARLRLETRPEHERLERDFPLMRADFTLADYRLALERLYGFYATYEERLRLGPKSWQPFLVPRRKTDLLRADLAVLGVEADKLPHFESRSREATMAEVIGSLYVTEGSTLGSQILVKHIQAVLGLPDDGAYRFFLGYGAETGAIWRSTRDWLEREASDQPSEQVIAGARETFVSMHEVLCG